MEEEIIYWEVLEYEPIDRDPEWFWAFGIVVASVSIAAILLENILFGVLVLLAGVTWVLYTKKGPASIKVHISEIGIMVHDNVHHYDRLISFSIDRDILLVERESLWHPLLIVPIGKDVSPHRVRERLSKKLKEKDHKEPLSHRIMDRLGF